MISNIEIKANFLRGSAAASDFAPGGIWQEFCGSDLPPSEKVSHYRVLTEHVTPPTKSSNTDRIAPAAFVGNIENIDLLCRSRFCASAPPYYYIL